MNKAHLLILGGNVRVVKKRRRKWNKKHFAFLFISPKAWTREWKKGKSITRHTWILFPAPSLRSFLKKSLNYSANLSLAVARLVLKKTIKASGLISDSRLIFNLHLCYFLMSCSFLCCHIVPYLTASFLWLPGLWRRTFSVY